jgi:hypothetical protein
MKMKLTLEPARMRPLLAFLAATALTVGCGEGQLQSPTGPSAAVGSTTSMSANAAAGTSDFELFGQGGNGGGNNGNGRGNGNGNGNGNGGDSGRDGSEDAPAENGGGPGRSQEAKVVGFVSAVTIDTLVVNGLRVAAGPDTLIRHGNLRLSMFDIEVGDHVQARGVMEGPILVATEIKVQDTGDDNEDVIEVDFEGFVSNLSPAAGCPVLTFTIGATAVTTSAATIFDDVTCATLANNAFVDVEGIRRADGSVLARKVEVEGGPDDLEGLVFDFSGAASCPAATFWVGPTRSLATRVTTTASTIFRDVACAALVNGTRVDVEGTRQIDGTIAAAVVEIDD